MTAEDMLKPLVIDLDKVSPEFIKDVLQPIWDLEDEMEKEEEDDR